MNPKVFSDKSFEYLDWKKDWTDLLKLSNPKAVKIARKVLGVFDFALYLAPPVGIIYLVAIRYFKI